VTDRPPGMVDSRIVAALAVALIFLLASLVASAHSVAAATTITAYKAQSPVKLDGISEPGEWNDTPQFVEKNSGMTAAFKQNGTGLLFLIQWTESSPYCTDSACYGGMELGPLDNTGEMGSPTTPTIMILASTSFKGGVDEFIATGEQTPAPVESGGYSTQSACGLTLVGQEYTAECYRPFALHDASPYDPGLKVGSAVEVGFAVGEFTSPGDHLASDMSTYVLSISNQTYTPASTSSSIATTSSGASSSGQQGSASSSSSTTRSSFNSTTSPVTSGPTAAPTYAEELLVISIGFTVLILVVLMKYERFD
jgi:hypothetical protein